MKKRLPINRSNREVIAEMLVEMSRGLFLFTMHLSKRKWRGKEVSRISAKDPTLDELPRAIRFKASKIYRTIDEKIARARLKELTRDFKAQGMSVHAAREQALEQVASLFGREVSSLARWDSGKADAQRRKPKAERLFARRKQRAKIIP